jgi:hypothetical protein
MKQENDDLNLIAAELERKNLEKGQVIPLESVLRWMASPDVEVKGAVYALTSKEEQTRRIQPPLTLEVDTSFVLSYFAQCIVEDPPVGSMFADSRFSACSDLVNWFKELWGDTAVPRSVMSDIKDWIARQFVNGDTEIRRTLVQATLEHLFEDPTIRDFFSDWRSESSLEDAYRQAKEWSEGRVKR